MDTNIRSVSIEETKIIKGGEAITLTIVLTYLAISVLTVIVWKLYTSGKGKISFPGGFNFEWSPGVYFNSFISMIF
ncbi:MAG: hypothetical protein WC123_00165 [Bacilli bacterium]|nr:hypothetical protein [Bacilli bacterium]